MKELGEGFRCGIGHDVDRFIGIEIERHGRCVKLHQKEAISRLLRQHGMDEANSSHLPGEGGTRLDMSDVDGESEGTKLSESEQSDFRSLVGSLMYIACNTRPDIMYQTGALSRFMKQAHTVHVVAAKRVLRYLRGTQDLGIWLGQKGQATVKIGEEPVVWTDSDWNTPRSTSGGIVLVDGPIRWWSRKQPVPALSSTEAEIIASSEAAREGRVIELQVDEFRCVVSKESKTGGPTCIGDNVATTLIARLEATRKRIKHLETRHFYVCSLSHWEYQRTETSNNMADALTKNLKSWTSFSGFRDRMGVA